MQVGGRTVVNGTAANCSCRAGFEGDGVERCSDVDECAGSPCGAHAVCTNLPGGFTCACAPGFRGNGYNCTEIDTCGEMRPCHRFADCRNVVPSSYQCTCHHGYAGSGESCAGCCASTSSITLERVLVTGGRLALQLVWHMAAPPHINDTIAVFKEGYYQH